MARATAGLLILALVLGAAGCARGAGTANSPRTLPDQITFEEIERRGPFTTLYDLVSILRPRWLRPQGPDTFLGGQGQVQVHMDGNRMGPVDVLRNLSAAGVTSLHWLSPIDAAARFGLDHGHGAIVISSAPVH